MSLEDWCHFVVSFDADDSFMASVGSLARLLPVARDSCNHEQSLPLHIEGEHRRRQSPNIVYWKNVATLVTLKIAM